MGGENVFLRLKPGINRRLLIQELHSMGIRSEDEHVADVLIKRTPMKVDRMKGTWYKLVDFSYGFRPNIFDEVNQTLEGVEEL